MKWSTPCKEGQFNSQSGGSNTEAVDHTCYRARFANVDESYYCNFEVLDQKVICNNVPPVRQGPWMAELQRLGVKITDTNVGPIEVLIGADVAGKLLTDQRKVLSCGLVAIGTHLGWTLIGKTSSVETDQSSVLTSVTSMFINESVARNRESRFEVHTPLIEDHPPLFADAKDTLGGWEFSSKKSPDVSSPTPVLGRLVRKPKKGARNIKRREIVLVERENKKRSSWLLAKVEDNLLGKYGTPRRSTDKRWQKNQDNKKR